MELDDHAFQALINSAVASLPQSHIDALKNVAIVYADEPSEAQRQQLKLHDDETLFGLYEGVPLPQRNGQTAPLPDKITIFKQPLLRASMNDDDMREKVRHTVWHEVAHYYGLNHAQIRELENGHL